MSSEDTSMEIISEKNVEGEEVKHTSSSKEE